MKPQRAAVLVAGLVAAACRPSAAPAPTPPARPVVYDLALAAPAADLKAPFQLTLFGTPPAMARQVSGFIPAPAPAREDTRVWLMPNVEIALDWPRAEERRILLDLAPHPEISAQAVDVQLNGAALAHLSLTPERRRYATLAPAKGQRPGRNVLRLEFSESTKPIKPHKKRLAAVLYSLAVGAAGDATLARLEARDAPPPLSAETPKGAPRLRQAGPSTLRFVVRAPADAALVFTPELDPLAKDGTAELEATIVEGGVERGSWKRTLALRGPMPEEVRLPLGAASGAAVEISLRVSGSAPFAQWTAPRIVGAGSGDPTPHAKVAAGVDRRADELRRALAGCNVVFVIFDAAGARHFSCYGYGRKTTPNVDRLAAEGVVFEDAYSPAGYTLFAMGSAWTSVYPDVHHNALTERDRLPKGFPTLAELLSAQGIHTAGFVGNSLAGPAYGLDRGFAEFDELSRHLKGGAKAFSRVLPGWIEANKRRRFFAYIHYREPHFAYNPPPPYDTMFGSGPLPASRREDYKWLIDVNEGRTAISDAEVEHLVRLYDGNLAFVDHELGELRKQLEAAGILEKTVVILAADHGEAHRQHGFIGHVGQVYEDILRIPLVVRFPGGKGPADARVKGLVDLVDLAPTVLDVFGVGAQAIPDSFRGRSLLPMLYGAPGKQAVVGRSPRPAPQYSLREGRLKVLYDSALGSTALYDVVADPGEKSDLAPAQPLAADFYRQALHRFVLSTWRSPAAVAEEAQLSEDQRENLRALGYVQ